MTDSKTYTVRGAEVIVTASVYPRTIDMAITLDLAQCDKGEPDHSPNQLIDYIDLPGYERRETYWWCKLHRKVTVKTGAQAHRVVNHALANIDDAIQLAVIARESRKRHMVDVFPA